MYTLAIQSLEAADEESNHRASSELRTDTAIDFIDRVKCLRNYLSKRLGKCFESFQASPPHTLHSYQCIDVVCQLTPSGKKSPREGTLPPSRTWHIILWDCREFLDACWILNDKPRIHLSVAYLYIRR